MANLSEAKGHMYLQKDFYLHHRDWIESLTKIQGDYGFWNISESSWKDSETIELPFDACGRWVFIDNTMECDWCWNPLENPVFDKMLKKDDPEIEMEFTEYEPNCEIFWAVDARVHPANKNGKKVISCTIHELDMSDSNRVNLGFEEEGLSASDVIAENPDVTALYKRVIQEYPEEYANINDFARVLKKRIKEDIDTKGAVTVERFDYWNSCPDVLLDFMKVLQE